MPITEVTAPAIITAQQVFWKITVAEKKMTPPYYFFTIKYLMPHWLKLLLMACYLLMAEDLCEVG